MVKSLGGVSKAFGRGQDVWAWSRHVEPCPGLLGAWPKHLGVAKTCRGVVKTYGRGLDRSRTGRERVIRLSPFSRLFDNLCEKLSQIRIPRKKIYRLHVANNF